MAREIRFTRVVIPHSHASQAVAPVLFRTTTRFQLEKGELF